MAVKVINAKQNHKTPAAGADRLKVAAYCRVSTDSEEQESSYEVQCEHYTDVIRSHEGWEFAGIYADEGITGTSTKKREEFNRMIRDAENGQINLILTKSLSRFARNTVDFLQTVRRLKALEIPVIFEKENINSMDATGEMLITVLASFAQQESESISRNVRLGIQYRMQQGKGRLNTSVFMGLTLGSEPGIWRIVREEADIVRRIFREFLEGFSPAMICKGLEADGIKTKAGSKIWYPTTITSMLENEKYCGDLLMQKYFVADPLTHALKKNTGQLPQYYVEQNHPPILPQDIFYQVQGELMRRAAYKDDPTKIRYGSTIALSRRLVCGRCGNVLKRHQNGDEVDWRCMNRAYARVTTAREVHSRCGCRYVPEVEAKRAIMDALNSLDRDELVRMHAEIRNGDLKRMDDLILNDKETEKRLEERRQEIDSNSNEALFLAVQITELEERRSKLILERAEYAAREVHLRLLLELADEMKGKVGEKKEYMDSCINCDEFFERTRKPSPVDMIQHGKIVQFDNAAIIRYLDKVIVEDDGYVVKLKGGVDIRVGGC